jgi:hypothetical protein
MLLRSDFLGSGDFRIKKPPPKNNLGGVKKKAAFLFNSFRTYLLGEESGLALARWS